MTGSTTPRRRRATRRLAILAAALVPAGAITAGAAGTAAAAGCATNGHVYLTSVNPRSFRFEDQPIEAGFDNYSFTSGSAPAFQVGGNGLRPGSTPIWNVSSNLGRSFGFSGRAAGSNCVANETVVRLPVTTQPGEVWQVRATYLAGNTGRVVQNQAHFQTTFVAPPPPPSYPWFPWYPWLSA
jgi:hypothetical protein